MAELSEAEKLLERLGLAEDDQFDLIEGALALAVLDAPGANREEYRRHLSLLAEDTLTAAGADPDIATASAALSHVISGLHGYRGDDETYDDLQNANLIRVIDRRRGLPVTLGIIYLATARACGWEAYGLSFPGHFMIRLDIGGGRAVIDPFHGGITREAPDLRELLQATGFDDDLGPRHYETVSDRSILLRVQNNIKMRLIQTERAAQAGEVVRTMLLFSPSQRNCGAKAVFSTPMLATSGWQ